MAAGERLRGEDTLVTITRNGTTVAEFPVSSCEVTVMMDTTAKRMLGEKSDRFDESFQGYELTLEGEAEGSDSNGWDALVDAAIARARRETSGTAINVATFHAYPNGDLKGYTYLDVRLASPRVAHSGNDHVMRSLTVRTGERKNVG